MSYPTTYPKRKWDEVDSSDDEEPSLGKQVLPVANLPADFAGDPEDGLQYLFLVRYVVSLRIHRRRILTHHTAVTLVHYHVQLELRIHMSCLTSPKLPPTMKIC